MEKIQFENDNFIIYSPDSLKYIIDNMIKCLMEAFVLYKDLFNIDDYRKVQINLFDNIDSFRNFIYDLRGEKESLPIYARGTYDNGMINSYITINKDVNSYQYKKTKYMASHELFHILYRELILDKGKKKRIIWFDEGMAQLFSGENDYNLNAINFSKWLNNLISDTKEIPDLNKLIHGESFVNENYNGYNLSLLAVKYLYDVLGKEKFKILMHNNDEVIRLGKNVIYDAINYYHNN